jgi:hypothetical protein
MFEALGLILSTGGGRGTNTELPITLSPSTGGGKKNKQNFLLPLSIHRKPLFYYLLSINFPILGISYIKYLSCVCVWIISLSTYFSGFEHVTAFIACMRILFF